MACPSLVGKRVPRWGEPVVPVVNLRMKEQGGERGEQFPLLVEVPREGLPPSFHQGEVGKEELEVEEVPSKAPRFHRKKGVEENLRVEEEFLPKEPGVSEVVRLSLPKFPLEVVEAEAIHWNDLLLLPALLQKKELAEDLRVIRARFPPGQGLVATR